MLHEKFKLWGQYSVGLKLKLSKSTIRSFNPWLGGGGGGEYSPGLKPKYSKSSMRSSNLEWGEVLPGQNCRIGYSAQNEPKILEA